MKKIQIGYLGVFIVLSIVALDGCYYDNRDDLYPVPVDTVVTFADDIEPFITGSCAGGASCHGSGSNNPVLETYDEIKNNIDRIRIRAIEDKTMPPAGPANQEQLDKLSKWIEEGTPNN